MRGVSGFLFLGNIQKNFLVRGGAPVDAGVAQIDVTCRETNGEVVVVFDHDQNRHDLLLIKLFRIEDGEDLRFRIEGPGSDHDFL